MKKILTLLVACFATVSMFAGEIVLTPAGLTEQTQTDINVTIQGVTLKYYGTLKSSDFRLFASQDKGATANPMTISYGKNIIKAELIAITKGEADGSDITTTAGTKTVATGEKGQVGTTVEITIDGINAQSFTIAVMKQLRIQQIKLTVEGEVEGGGNEGGEQGDNEGDNEGGGNEVNPSDTLTVAQAIAIAKGAPGNTQYIVKGYVTYSYGYKEQYDNIDLFISDTPDGGQDFEIFRAKMIGTEPQVGDLVAGTGTITTFVKGDGTTIYEITNGTVEVLVAGEGGGNESGDEGDYSWEPTEITTITHEFTTGASIYTKEGIIDFYVEDEKGGFELYFISPSTTGIPAGTYPINSSIEDGTVYASPGGDEYYDYPSFYFTGIEYDEEYEAYYYTQAYYIVSGTVTVTGDNSNQNIVVAGKSYNGSTLNLTYTGVVEEWAEDTAVEDVTMQNNNVRKVLENGQVIIIRESVRYNVLGTQIH